MRDFAVIEQEWPHMQKLLAWADEPEQDQLLVELMLLLVHYMDTSFHYNERLEYSRKAAKAADRLGRKREAALFYIDALAWILIEEGRL